MTDLPYFLRPRVDLVFARDYPFAAPAHDYAFLDGDVVPIDVRGADPVWDAVVPGDGGPVSLVDVALGRGIARAALEAPRFPVVAYGSNRAPRQLHRKYRDLPGTLIPVTRATLCDFDVVYSAHFARYGSLPATIARSPGTRVDVFVCWLTDDQVDRMHWTEGLGTNQHYRALEPATVLWGDAVLSEPPGCYHSVRGALTAEDDRPVALAALPAEGRRLPALGQEEMLRMVCRWLDVRDPLDTFLERLITDERFRRRMIEGLASRARQLA